jgi:putative hydrolase of the HAD superfamily
VSEPVEFASPARVRAVLIDVDGVLRVWESGQIAAIEERYGVPSGMLSEIAYERERFGPALLGEITDDDWRASVAAALVPVCGDVTKAIACVVDWSARLGLIDPDVLDIIEELRGRGLPVGLIANATDRLQKDLVSLRVQDQIDAVIDSAHCGFAKPDAGIFEAAAGILAVRPEQCLYVGARPEHVAGAERTGMMGHLYTGVPGLREMLAALPAD